MSKIVTAENLNHGDVVLEVENFSQRKATAGVLERLPYGPQIIDSISVRRLVKAWNLAVRVAIKYRSYARSVVRPERLYRVATTNQEREGAL